MQAITAARGYPITTSLVSPIEHDQPARSFSHNLETLIQAHEGR